MIYLIMCGYSAFRCSLLAVSLLVFGVLAYEDDQLLYDGGCRAYKETCEEIESSCCEGLQCVYNVCQPIVFAQQLSYRGSDTMGDRRHRLFRGRNLRLEEITRRAKSFEDWIVPFQFSDHIRDASWKRSRDGEVRYDNEPSFNSLKNRNYRYNFHDNSWLLKGAHRYAAAYVPRHYLEYPQYNRVSPRYFDNGRRSWMPRREPYPVQVDRSVRLFRAGNWQ